jgi:hypothetical protein
MKFCALKAMLLAVLLASSFPIAAQESGSTSVEAVTTAELDEIRQAFQAFGLRGADVALASDGRATLTGEYEDRNEVETAFAAARAVLGLRRVAPTTPTNIKYRLRDFDSTFASTVRRMMGDGKVQPPGKSPSTTQRLQDAPAAPRTYGVVVGVSKFRHLPEKHQLQFAAKDARDFHDALVTPRSGRLAGEDIRLLRNEQANARAVHEAFGRLLEVTEPGDTVVIFVASHGLPNALGQFDVVLHDTVFTEKKATAKEPGREALNIAVTDRSTTLTDEDLREFIAKMALKDVRTVLVLDACYSGKTFAAVPGFLPSRTRSVTRYKREVDYRTSPSSESVAQLAMMAREAKATRIVVVSASENEESLEMPEVGGGVFTQLYIAQLKQAQDYADAFDRTKPLVINKARTVGFSQTPRLLVLPEEARTRM